MPLARRAWDRLLGAPEDAPATAVLRALAWGGPGLRCRAARALGVGEPGEEGRAALRRALADPVPGVRRGAAWSLGRLGDPGQDRDRLLAAARLEARDEARLSMAVAAARLGAPAGVAWEILERSAGRVLHTCHGPRAVAELSGAGRAEQARRFVQILGPGSARSSPEEVRPEPPDAIRARLWEEIRRDPERRDLFDDLGAQQDPRDLEPMTALTGGAGRRASAVHVLALGSGDPRVLPRLVEVLRAVDVDPGAGFASRARAARALGRLGLPEAIPALTRALEDEALDHEGRPGAGLGVQLPVREALLAALGECGDATVAPLLAGYLGNVHGSARGGFHLQAMDALLKIGETASLVALLGGPELAAANAEGVLRALGRVDLVEGARARR